MTFEAGTSLVANTCVSLTGRVIRGFGRVSVAAIFALAVILQPPTANAQSRALISALIGGIIASHMGRHYRHYSHRKSFSGSFRSHRSARKSDNEKIHNAGGPPQKSSDPFAGVAPSGTVQVRGQ
jgi:hypothetical protein